MSSVVPTRRGIALQSNTRFKRSLIFSRATPRSSSIELYLSRSMKASRPSSISRRTFHPFQILGRANLDSGDLGNRDQAKALVVVDAIDKYLSA